MTDFKKKKWKISKDLDDKFPKDFPEYNDVILKMLFNRGLRSGPEIEEFMNPKNDKSLYDPYLFRDMEKAVDLIVGHIKKQNKIIIFGDYDADGVTASSLLVNFLKTVNANVDVYLPDRTTEGYGVNKKAVEYFVESEVSLIITVDSGIKSKDEIKFAIDNNIDVIVTDHHPAEESEMPECLIINPVLESEKYSYKYLAGVGVAFKLALAIMEKSKLSDEDKLLLENRMLPLVAIGTIADCVPLLGENRLLVKRGLKEIENTKNVGINALVKVSGLTDKKIEAWNIGFQIAPRINAAGRIGHASMAYELLTSTEEDKASKLAGELDERNKERREMTDDIFFQVDDLVKNKKDKILIGIFELEGKQKKQAWNEGVIGIVAGRITEKYYKPSLVITKIENGYKGSGRSIPELNLAEAISEVGEHLDKYGGHPMACGFSTSESKIEKFRDGVIQNVNQKLKDVDLVPGIEIESELRFSEVNEDLIGDIEKFEPFGQSNNRPRFVSRGVSVVNKTLMGDEGQHLKLGLSREGQNLIFAIGFGQAEKWKDINEGDKIDIVYYLEINEFNNRRSIQMKIVDIEKTTL